MILKIKNKANDEKEITIKYYWLLWRTLTLSSSSRVFTPRGVAIELGRLSKGRRTFLLSLSTNEGIVGSVNLASRREASLHIIGLQTITSRLALYTGCNSSSQ